MTQGPIALPPSPLPWVAGVQVHSFLLPRAEPVVIYNSPALAQVRFETRPERLLLSHWHEALGADPGIPAYLHEADRAHPVPKGDMAALVAPILDRLRAGAMG